VQVSPVLVIGASGFVGRHLCVTLEAAGVALRRATSRRRVAESSNDGRHWVYLDLRDANSLGGAIEGCRSIVYLYHGLGTGAGYGQREALAASALAVAAAQARVERLVYLGGVIPQQGRSMHLESRRVTGEILRSGAMTTLELRAAMIVGHGSASFKLIRDLAVRLPYLVLPPWLDNASYPISIDDVSYALARALEVPLAHSAWFELPGSERITHRELVQQLSELFGTRVLRRRLGLLSPKLSARILAIVGREPRELVSELVYGLPSDLLPHGESFWSRINEQPTRSLRESLLSALGDESSKVQPSAATEERLRRRGETLQRLIH